MLFVLFSDLKMFMCHGVKELHSIRTLSKMVHSKVRVSVIMRTDFPRASKYGISDQTRFYSSLKTAQSQFGTRSSNLCPRMMHNIGSFSRKQRINAFSTSLPLAGPKDVQDFQNTGTKKANINVKSAQVALKKIKRKNTATQKKKVWFKPGKDAWSVVGYSTAESYDLLNLERNLASQVKSNYSKNGIWGSLSSIMTGPLATM